ncbi:hypothetical protein OG824_11390 [Streptomyces prunicolor]|uniref:hypothetical protein n=1 Tax=Streptomyces prunicolor TaxID=67348 RepID=UPI002254DF3C|nr:hypothetical protein [Streptomyces prunicolor]MCX5235812.1 hypothetical protein [Streptomyces prunicolor]
MSGRAGRSLAALGRAFQAPDRYDTAPRDSWSAARPRTVLATMLVEWGPVTVFVWLVGRMADDPPSWTASAVFGALFVVGGYLGDRLKERRRARARARTAADPEGP